MTSEFYAEVPKGLVENLEYRKNTLLCAAKDVGVQRMLMEACRQDVLFFFSAFCVAKGTPVVTDRGFVPIESVSSDDLVWDGESWVETGGAVFQGLKTVIGDYGVGLTENHLVWTKYGWKSAGNRYDRAPVRLPYGYRKSGILQGNYAGCVEGPLRLREGENCLRLQPSARINNELRVQSWRKGSPWSQRGVNSQYLVCDDPALHESKLKRICELWRSRDFCLRQVDDFRELPCRHGRTTGREVHGSHRQRRQLRARECSLGNSYSAGLQSAYSSLHEDRNVSWKSDARRDIENYRAYCADNTVSHSDWSCWGRTSSEENRSAQVYDLLNCGPNKAFTVIDKYGEPLLVHNCWLYEPRPRKLDGLELPKKIPFCPWPHQEPVIVALREALGYRDCILQKARSEGGSWVGCWLALHDFVFKPLTAIGMVSKSLEAADNVENPDSLGWKLDWGLAQLPKWMQPRISRKIADHTIQNLDNGSGIAMYAATGTVASGGRRSWFLLDELAKFPHGPDSDAMASTQYVTDSRLIVSTPFGSSGEYYRLCQEPSDALMLKLSWRDNPSRNRGLYEFRNGIPVAVDPINNPLPPEYNPPDKRTLEMFSILRRRGFKLEGMTRSQWFDSQCFRGASTPTSVAQELEMDFGGSMHRVFMHDFMEAAEKKIEKPHGQYTLDYNEETLEIDLQKDDSGQVHLWTELDVEGNPPQHQYVVSADISAGLGGSYTSNSVCQVVDMLTGRQVLEYAVNVIEPGDFADECIAIAKFFGNAFLIWEVNGVGGAFTNRIKKRQYGNVYYRSQHMRKGTKKTKALGWQTNSDSKEMMFAELSKAIRNGDLTIHSKHLLQEFGNFVRIDGKIEHALAKNTSDESSKGQSHGDRVIAMAMAVMGMRDRPLPVLKKRLEASMTANPPPNTLASRDKWFQDQLKKDTDEWDERDNIDLAQSSRVQAFGASLRD